MKCKWLKFGFPFCLPKINFGYQNYVHPNNVSISKNCSLKPCSTDFKIMLQNSFSATRYITKLESKIYVMKSHLIFSSIYISNDKIFIYKKTKFAQYKFLDTYSYTE